MGIEEEKPGVRLVHGGDNLPVDPGDLDALFDVYSADVLDGGRGDKESWFKECVRDSNTVLAFDGERLIGLSEWHEDTGRALYGSLVSRVVLGATVVLPAYRGFGIGKQLYDRVLADIRSKYDTVWILLMTKNAKLMESLKQDGFREISLREYFAKCGVMYAPGKEDSVQCGAARGFKAFQLDIVPRSKPVHGSVVRIFRRLFLSKAE